MSRVDEALRRASAARDDDREDVAAISSPAAAHPEDVPALAAEPFPLEMPHRRTRPAAGTLHEVSSQQTLAPDPRATDSPAARPPEPLPSLLERIHGDLAEKVVIDANMTHVSREQYRRLAATLHDAQATADLKVILISSALVGEGKTLTTSNLALTLSESYRRQVLLIDADMRRPQMHAIFGVDNTSGLHEGLLAPEERKLPVRQVSRNLAILPAGRPSSDPMAGLTSNRMRRVLAEARAAFDWVIIDSPPVVLLPDAGLLASMADGVVLVVKAGATPYEMVRRAIEALGKDRILGTVLNRSQEPPHGAHSYYDYYYSPGTAASADAATPKTPEVRS